MTLKRILNSILGVWNQFREECRDVVELINKRDSTITTHNYENIKGDNLEVTSFEPGHVDVEFIHNLTGYYKLSEKNTKRWDELNKILHRRYGVYFHEEVLKEIAVDRLFKGYTINDIDQLITDYEQIPKIDNGDEL